MIARHRASPRRPGRPPRRHLREIRLALRQLDTYVARMADPSDERLLAAASATLDRTIPERSTA